MLLWLSLRGAQRQGQVGRDGGAEVEEVLHPLQGVVANAICSSGADILGQTLCMHRRQARLKILLTFRA